MSQAPSLILPVEVQSRELDAKLLLACVAAERGQTAILGCAQAIKRGLHALPRGVYVAKGIVKPDLFRRVERFGHRVMAWDEEALVYMTHQTYLRRKVSAEALGAARALFAWGEDNAEIWRGAPGYAGQPLFVTGNPRADLLRADLRAYFAPEAEALRGRFGRFVLICSNFGYLQHYLPKLTKAHDETAAVPEDKLGTLDDHAMLAHRWQMLQAFKYMIPQLARTLPERTIIVRPHPSESAAHWQEAAAGQANVQVVGGGPVVPWLMAADAVLHNGCTTAVEGFLLGRPTIAYEPIRHPLYDIWLPNDLSHRAEDIETLAQRICATDDAAFAPAPEQEALASRFVAARDGALASERIVAAVEDVMARDPAWRGGPPSLATRAAGAWRNLRRMPRAWLGGDDEWSGYLRHRFPDLKPGDVEARLRRLKAVTGRFDGVALRQRGKNIYEAARR